VPNISQGSVAHVLGCNVMFTDDYYVFTAESYDFHNFEDWPDFAKLSKSTLALFWTHKG